MYVIAFVAPAVMQTSLTFNLRPVWALIIESIVPPTLKVPVPVPVVITIAVVVFEKL